MPKCPCCHSEIRDFKGILFHDLDRVVYIDNAAYPMKRRAYKAVKAVYDHGPMPPERLALLLYGYADDYSMKRAKEDVSEARAALGSARMQINHLSNSGGDQYRILEFTR